MSDCMLDFLKDKMLDDIEVLFRKKKNVVKRGIMPASLHDLFDWTRLIEKIEKLKKLLESGKVSLYFSSLNEMLGDKGFFLIQLSKEIKSKESKYNRMKQFLKILPTDNARKKFIMKMQPLKVELQELYNKFVDNLDEKQSFYRDSWYALQEYSVELDEIISRIEKNPKFNNAKR